MVEHTLCNYDVMSTNPPGESCKVVVEESRRGKITKFLKSFEPGSFKSSTFCFATLTKWFKSRHCFLFKTGLVVTSVAACQHQRKVGAKFFQHLLRKLVLRSFFIQKISCRENHKKLWRKKLEANY